MAAPKTGISKKGTRMHYSVGALVEHDNKYLLIDRTKFPFGFAGIAGHVDEGETEIDALYREVQEESGLEATGHELLFEEELDWNACRRGIGTHYWRLYKCTVAGEIRKNTAETKSIGWYTLDQIRKLTIEPAWEYWFKKLGMLD